MLFPSIGEEFILPFLFPTLLLSIYYNYIGLDFNIIIKLFFI